MDEIIHKIIKIEAKAQTVMDEAREIESSLDNVVNEEMNKRQDEVEAKILEKQKTITEIETKNADEKIQLIQSKLQEQRTKIDKRYQENKDAWVEQIFQNIISQ